jgi:GABA permease
MTSTKRLLVVANRTADSTELFDELQRRAEEEPIAVTLLVPQEIFGGQGRRLNAALTRLHDAGITAEGMLGDTDPVIAVQEAWNPSRFDEILVSTLPSGVSRWLGLDLPHRVARLTGATVSHVVSHEVEHATSVPFA